MGSWQDEELTILHTGGPCIMEDSGLEGIKPTTLVTEAHTLSSNEVNPIISPSISIYF